MKKTLLTLSSLILCLSPFSVAALQSGDYTYSSDGSVITIIQYTGTNMNVSIPGTIEGLPVGIIDSRAFQYSTVSLTNVTIPASVTNMGSEVFSYIDSLLCINVDPANPAFSSADGILFNGDKTALIQCPAGKTGACLVPSGVVRIEDYAFEGCSQLTGMTIPPGVGSVGRYAFTGCTGLTNLTLPGGISNIGTYAFSYCSGLTNMTIPASVTSIGLAAFTHCTGMLAIDVDPANTFFSSLDGVLFSSGQATLIQYPGGRHGSYSIPSGVGVIGNTAFGSCAELTGITIPDGVCSIESNAFSFCSGLTNVSLPSGLTNLASFSFSRCLNLATITIPSGVARISTGAFYFCTKLTNATISAGVVSIDERAFNRCLKLERVAIPATVTNIGNMALSYCPSMMAITVDPANAWFLDDDGVLFNKGKTTLVQCPGGRKGSYAIPSGITQLGGGAFYGCASLENITIPTGITRIGDWMFSSCSSLTNITIPSGVTNIGIEAFSLCIALESVVIPNGVTQIGMDAFSGCETLGSAMIPPSITSIPDEIFIFCYALTNVTIGDTLTSIGDAAFYGCSSLGDVVIPAVLTNIGASAFTDCTGMRNISVNVSNAFFSSRDGVLFNKAQTVLLRCPAGREGRYTIPASVTNIAEAAFSGSVYQTSVTVPAGVNGIGQSGFDGCDSLSGVFFKGNAPKAESYIFNFSDAVVVYCLPGTTGWGETYGNKPVLVWNPFIQGSGVQAGQFRFTIAGTTNIPVVVEASETMGGAWTPLQSGSLTNGQFHFSDPDWAGYTARFYRVRSP